jgi:hypothetical protein
MSENKVPSKVWSAYKFIEAHLDDPSSNGVKTVRLRQGITYV